MKPLTEAGQAVVDDPSVLLMQNDTEIIGVNEGELELQLVDIEQQAIAAYLGSLPPHTRLILASEDLLDQFGTRTEDGHRIAAEWGEPSPEGWYTPNFTVHYDKTPLVDLGSEAFRERLARALESYFPTPEPKYVWTHMADLIAAAMQEEGE